MAVRSTSVSVSTTAALVSVGTDTDMNASYRDLGFYNSGATTVYLGGSDVSSANGYPLAAGDRVSFNNVNPDSIPYARVASGTGTLIVLEVGV